MSQKPWRPDKDWDAVEVATNVKGYTSMRKELIKEYGRPTLESYEALLVEAGADTMLEARKESGIRVVAGDLPESVRLMLGLDSQKYGWINFIPEGENK